ncbi:hypothetical protein [Sphingosinithalassobacter sp. LHW66-3]|uniref:hypothetical protein n=1 Tax=Sphingosinithalassobacter sp. LHW66-3 TaxID=3424718 RepID=UPI003D6AB2A1
MTHGRSPIPPEPASDREPFAAGFDPVPTPRRHDGWSAEKQVEFIEALAASGCVDHAARAVGMHASSAYRLRARPDATSFRAAWEHALEYAVQRLAEATLSRAIHGVARPVFYQGEIIGERRYYDERLAMFILRMRDPVRYGAWIDGYVAARAPDAEAQGFARAASRLADDAWADELGAPRPRTPVGFPERFHRSEEQLHAERVAHDEMLARQRRSEPPMWDPQFRADYRRAHPSIWREEEEEEDEEGGT